ncbi:MAG TPA: 5-dehydro-2-deoxygluconokinase, partial [Steroidobacteraceae bacterium]|nr:5-dehydro-2-deoxygluconokinase [Steroidobacteraceae bacterium]
NAPIEIEYDARIKIIVQSIFATVSAIVAGTDSTLDLIAVGRSSVDLYGEQLGGRLEDMGSFAKYLGGSPTNTAVAAARLGLKTGLLTRVGADHMGRFIREQLAREGVDVHGVLSDSQRLTALVVLGIRDRETFPLIFYRENCADMALCEEDLDATWLGKARAVLINGTHLSTPGVLAASVGAARQVKAAGGRVVFDVDYRPVLWGLTPKDLGENRFVAHAAVTQRLQNVLPLCDLVVGTEEEIRILGGAEDMLAALKNVRARTPATIVLKRGAHGCVVFPGRVPDNLEEGVVARGFRVEVYNVLGAGDAFMGGYLRGWLRDEPIEQCCRLANACGAIVVSRHGCAPAMPTWTELQHFLAAREHRFRLREDAQLAHVHWATTRVRTYEDLTVLAIDHRSQFEELAAKVGADRDLIPRFKMLGLRAVDTVAQGDARFGILLDGRYGFDALAQAANHSYWIGRPIEVPRSRPLEFESSADVASELLTWPLNHVVKCLVLYHPDDEPDLRARQERQLLRLFDACRNTRHELLVEIIVPGGMPFDTHTAARAITRIYEIGVRPDWWKLEPSAHLATWKNIESAISRGDPYCRGVVILGLSAPHDQLVGYFATAAPCKVVKGFAVGRTIFNEVAREWFRGRMSDEAAVKGMAERLAALVSAWRQARAEAAA